MALEIFLKFDLNLCALLKILHTDLPDKFYWALKQEMFRNFHRIMNNLDITKEICRAIDVPLFIREKELIGIL
jgi:hypothetical protein